MHQLLRLLYSDQQTPPGKLFRFESFDTRDIREAVGQLLIGVNGYELYESQIQLRTLNASYENVNRSYRAAISALPQSEGLTTVAALNARILEVTDSKNRALSQIQNLDYYIQADQTNDFSKQRREMQSQIRTMANSLSQSEQIIADLQDEIGEITQFIEHLTSQLDALKAANTVSEKLGSIEFQYCPSCLKPLTAAHIILTPSGNAV